MSSDFQKWIEELKRQQGGAGRQPLGGNLSDRRQAEAFQPAQQSSTGKMGEGSSDLDRLLEEARRAREAKRRASQFGQQQPGNERETRRQEHLARDNEEERQRQEEKAENERRERERLKADHRKQIESRLRAKRVPIADGADADSGISESMESKSAQPGLTLSVKRVQSSSASQAERIKQLLHNPQSLRDAFVLSEILGSPIHNR